VANWNPLERPHGRLASKIDTALETKDREIAELRKRLSDVEDKLR